MIHVRNQHKLTTIPTTKKDQAFRLQDKWVPQPIFYISLDLKKVHLVLPLTSYWEPWGYQWAYAQSSSLFQNIQRRRSPKKMKAVNTTRQWQTTMTGTQTVAKEDDKARSNPLWYQFEEKKVCDLHKMLKFLTTQQNINRTILERQRF